MEKPNVFIGILTSFLVLLACENTNTSKEKGNTESQKSAFISPKELSEPLISDHFTADPSAHIFEDKIYF